MFRTLPKTRDFSLTYRLAAIAVFVVLIALSAQFRFYIAGNPVPYTLQVFVVLLSGMVLGSRDALLTQLTYIGLIGLNLPIAAGGMGAAALTGATMGYLVGFIPAAWLVGFMVEHGANRTWQRWLAGLAGVAVIYAFGLPTLKLILNVDWATAWSLSVAPFILVDILKAIFAAAMAESGRALLLRLLNPR